MQEQPYDNPDYDKPTFLEREVKKTKPKKTTDKYGFDLRPDRNGGIHKAQTGTTLEQKQFNSPAAVKMRKTISKQKASLKKRAWSDSSLEPNKKKMKNGGSIAKDGKWMQKVSASIKKRGTAGKCTPITKPGCTGKAKALAKTFKKIAKSNKKK